MTTSLERWKNSAFDKGNVNEIVTKIIGVLR